MDREKNEKVKGGKNEICGGEWKIIEKTKKTKNIATKKGKKKKDRWGKSCRIKVAVDILGKKWMLRKDDTEK